MIGNAHSALGSDLIFLVPLTSLYFSFYSIRNRSGFTIFGLCSRININVGFKILIEYQGSLDRLDSVIFDDVTIMSLLITLSCLVSASGGLNWME